MTWHRNVISNINLQFTIKFCMLLSPGNVVDTEIRVVIGMATSKIFENVRIHDNVGCPVTGTSFQGSNGNPPI